MSMYLGSGRTPMQAEVLTERTQEGSKPEPLCWWAIFALFAKYFFFIRFHSLTLLTDSSAMLWTTPHDKVLAAHTLFISERRSTLCWQQQESCFHYIWLTLIKCISLTVNHTSQPLWDMVTCKPFLKTSWTLLCFSAGPNALVKCTQILLLAHFFASKTTKCSLAA